MQRWSFGIQHQFPQRVLAEVSYVGNRGTKLPVATALNPVPAQYLSTLPVRDQQTINHLSAQVTNPFFPLLPGTGLAGRNVARSQLLRPFPHFLGVGVLSPNGYSWYHSLQTRAERRFASGFTVHSSYTWSKFMAATSLLNESDLRPEEVISSEDRPHRFTFTGVWELPFGPGKPIWGSARGLAAHLAGGWQVQGAYEGQSGPAIGFGNIIFTGNLHEVPLPVSQRTTERWFNADAGFERDSRFQLASNSRRFSSRFTGIEAHGLNMWSLSGFKNFRLREGITLQFRSEWLNALNHTHLSPPVTAPTNTLFGQVTGTTGLPRQIHFALKLLF